MTASTPPLSDPRSTTAAVTHPDSGGASMTLTAERIADLEDALRAREAEAEQHLPATVPACPEWCGEGAGHEYVSYKADLRTWVRHHTAEIADAIWLQQDEEAVDGTVTLSPVTVAVSLTDPERLDAGQTRKLASDLAKAAQRLEAVTA